MTSSAIGQSDLPARLLADLLADPLVGAIFCAARECGGEARIVGGAVRDICLIAEKGKKTAESGLSEINNLLSMIRALAVEGTDATLTDADRTTLQVEVDAYLSEIDAITKTTKYNELVLLDGSSTTAKFNIGNEANSSLSISLIDSDSVALNLSATSGVSEFTSGRVTSFNYSSNLAANDILINGENALAATLTSNLTSGNNTATALATAINANSSNHGAVATGFNSLTSSVISNLSMSNTFTINSNTISVQTSLANLITEINQEASGVTAVLNSDNSIGRETVSYTHLTLPTKA